MSKTALNAPRSNMFCIYHDESNVLIRMIEDPNHPEYDARVELPVDEELIGSILISGQLEPALGYKKWEENGIQIVILNSGRQRWKAIREIWKRMTESGSDMKTAPVFKILISPAKNEGQRFQDRTIENRHRQPLEGLALAKDLATYLGRYGQDERSRETARIVFNFKSLAAMDNCLALLDTTEKVQNLLSEGVLSPTAALQLAHQPAEVQNQVAERIESETESVEDEEEAEGDAIDPAQIDAFHDERPTAPSPTRAPSVRDVKEMIRDANGQQTYAVVTLKQIEKQIEKKESELDKALTKLEDCTDQAKMADQAARVAGIQEYIKALRWTRGENATSTSSGAASSGNDKMSAAWDALRDAIILASWPTIVPMLRVPWEYARRSEPDYEANYYNAFREARITSEDSHILFVVGEVAAIRRASERGVTTSIRINVASKWFTRLMDPFGSPSNLVRDWGAHSWIVSHGKSAGQPNYKQRIHNRNGDQVLIEISADQLQRWVKDTAIGTSEPIETTVLRIVRSNIPERTASDLARESRFASPWIPASPDEDFVGPDLQEDYDARDQILSEIHDVFEIEFIPSMDQTWATVGELIDYVENLVAKPSASESETVGGAE